MAESELNFDAPLLSTRRLKKTAVSVRTNMSNKPNESHSVPVLVQESASVPSKCQPIDGNMTRLLSSESKQGETSEEDDDDDAFSDARDTLSGVIEGMTPSRQSDDSQPRDFMLNRFLPAAKSMTVEKQPQYALKRQPFPLMSEPMRQIRDIIPAENTTTPKRYESFTTPSYFQGIYDEESEDDDSDDDGVYLSKRGCGMMSPQLCFKNSLGMMSSVNGLKEKPYSLKNSSYDQVKSSKVSQLKSRFQSVKKLALDSIYKQKLGSKAQSPLHPSVGSEQLESNLSTASRPSSPYRQTGCMSPYRTVGNISPLHPATRKEAEIMRANRLNKHIRNNNKSQELLYPKSTRLDCSTSSVMEKTLCVDTQNSPQTSNNKGNSYINISPETIETVSEEQEITGNKPKDLLKLQTAETLITSSKIKNMEADLSPLVPPTPKKPSDSWLFRNLPSVSSRIPSRIHHPKKELEENSTSVTKWETIVKTSCIHRDHIRYSEDLVTRSSCQTKT